MRKLLLLLAFLIFCALPSHAAVSVTASVGHDNNCSGATTCNLAVGGTSVVQHDTLVLIVTFCYNTACNATPAGCVLTASDGNSNSYVFNSGASTLSTAVPQGVLVVADVNTTTVGLQPVIALSGTSCVFSNHTEMFLVRLAGADHTTPVDASVSAHATGTSTAPSVTSAGNVGRTGELAIAGGNLTSTNMVWTAPYSFLTETFTNVQLATASPSSGSTTTATGTMSSALWTLSLISIQPPSTGVKRLRGQVIN